MGVELLKMMKHGNSWYSNWVKEGFMYSILSYIRADIRLHQCIECLSAHIILYCYFLLNVSIYIDELYVPLALPPDRSTSAVCFLNWRISSLSRPAIYDVVEEKADSEPDFQYIPEKSPQDPAQLDQHALRDSMVTLKEGLSSGAILAQFDVRRNGNQHTHYTALHTCPNKLVMWQNVGFFVLFLRVRFIFFYKFHINQTRTSNKHKYPQKRATDLQRIRSLSVSFLLHIPITSCPLS